ncbi:hypothetical protein Uis1B_2213 [Bifidobacterium margollesii]|uniref:Uncharacterized protein n=1 Tax=Bifidobacterium margollesii TaxID=2020964 RepID=A0A2N5J6V2_9BIFI|nr:hypothetical protein [Bifidobacterium margollesii]PLS29945.1 hypothetical protein Uis1B_2213 [Bifidobacterium margollesii]
MRFNDGIYSEIQSFDAGEFLGVPCDSDHALEYDHRWDVYRRLQIREAGYDPDGPLTDEQADEADLTDIYVINRIDADGLLYDALGEWYGSRRDIVNHVRSAVIATDPMTPCRRWLYWPTGIGYDTISADLLDRPADGNARRQLIDLLNNDRRTTA